MGRRFGSVHGDAFRTAGKADIEIREVDNTAVREAQIKRLNAMKASRDEAAVEAALQALTDCAKTGSGNLLTLSVEAARLRATLGEISDALEKVFGRYQAEIPVVGWLESRGGPYLLSITCSG